VVVAAVLVVGAAFVATVAAAESLFAVVASVLPPESSPPPQAAIARPPVRIRATDRLHMFTSIADPRPCLSDTPPAARIVEVAAQVGLTTKAKRYDESIGLFADPALITHPFRTHPSGGSRRLGIATIPVETNTQEVTT
jgi:hypothetical protein